MTIKWYKSTSAVKPEPISLNWSPRYVYLHKNIQEKDRVDIDGATYKEWEYDEACLTRADYAIYAAEQNTNDIIAAEKEITEQDLSMIEAEQEITDLDLRLMELENA